MNVYVKHFFTIQMTNYDRNPISLQIVTLYKYIFKTLKSTQKCILFFIS